MQDFQKLHADSQASLGCREYDLLGSFFHALALFTLHSIIPEFQKYNLTSSSSFSPVVAAHADLCLARSVQWSGTLHCGGTEVVLRRGGRWDMSGGRGRVYLGPGTSGDQIRTAWRGSRHRHLAFRGAEEEKNYCQSGSCSWWINTFLLLDTALLIHFTL